MAWNKCEYKHNVRVFFSDSSIGKHHLFRLFLIIVWHLSLADVVAFHFVLTVQKMLRTNVQIVEKIWVSINVHLLSLVEVVLPQELVTTEAMHMAQQIVTCPQQSSCQMTKAKLGNKHWWTLTLFSQDCPEMHKPDRHHPLCKQQYKLVK